MATPCFNSSCKCPHTCGCRKCDGLAVTVLHATQSPTPYKPLCDKCITAFRKSLASVQQKGSVLQEGEHPDVLKLRLSLLKKPLDEIPLKQWLESLPVREVMEP